MALSSDMKWARRIRNLAILYIFFGLVNAGCGVIYFFFDDTFISLVLQHILLDLPEVTGIVSFNLWIIYAVVNLAIYISAMMILIAWEITAPLMALVSVPSLAGGIGLLYKKKWAMKTLVITSVFYGILFFPLGIAFPVFTFLANRKQSKIEIEKSSGDY